MAAQVDLEAKPKLSPDYQEFDAPPIAIQRVGSATRAVEGARLGLTVLAFVAGVVILATSADTLTTYNETHLSEDFFLPLWPNNFNIRPTMALVTCGSIILIASAISLAVSKIPALSSKVGLRMIVSLLTPVISLIAGIIGTSFFYGVNASETEFSLQGWSCQWTDVNMSTEPNFSMLCDESQAALSLTVMIIPLQILVLGMSVIDLVVSKKGLSVHDRKESPAMS